MAGWNWTRPQNTINHILNFSKFNKLTRSSQKWPVKWRPNHSRHEKWLSPQNAKSHSHRTTHTTNTYFFPISPITEAKAGLSLAVAYHLSRNAPRAVVSAAGGTSRRPRLPSPSCLEPILALRHAGEMHKVRGKVKTNKHWEGRKLIAYRQCLITDTERKI